jgi:hypothetical protein
MFISIYFHHFKESLVALNLQASSYNSVEFANCLNFEVSGIFFFKKKNLFCLFPLIVYDYDFV